MRPGWVTPLPDVCGWPVWCSKSIIDVMCLRIVLIGEDTRYMFNVVCRCMSIEAKNRASYPDVVCLNLYIVCGTIITLLGTHIYIF